MSPPASRAPLSLVVRPTEGCSSRCACCQAARRDAPLLVTGEAAVSLLLQRVDACLGEDPRAAVDLLWRGGEPLLAGPSWRARLADLVAEACPRTAPRIRHGMQTDLTLPTAELPPARRRLGLRAVGTSDDPDGALRGPGSPDGAARHRARFLEGLALLEREGIGLGLVFVVTLRALAEPVPLLRFLTNLAAGRLLSLVPVVLGGGVRDDLAVAPEEHARFLAALFPVFRAGRRASPRGQPSCDLPGVADGSDGRTPSLALGVCEPRLAQLEVDPAGDVRSAGRRGGPLDVAYGPLETLDLSGLTGSEARRRLLRSVEQQRRERCAPCPALRWCQPDDGGADRLVEPDAWCLSRVAVVRELVEPLAAARGGDARHAA